jgi:hypothetical protein
MPKQHEHTAWARINRRLGAEVGEFGERDRPSYYGQILECQATGKFVQDRKIKRSEGDTKKKK